MSELAKNSIFFSFWPKMRYFFCSKEGPSDNKPVKQVVGAGEVIEERNSINKLHLIIIFTFSSLFPKKCLPPPPSQDASDDDLNVGNFRRVHFIAKLGCG